MASSPKAIVKPELLVWARTSIGLSLDDAASKMHQSVERLTAWENGEQSPTVSQLRIAASVYKRPIAVFYLPNVPREFDAMKDFRRLSEGFNSEHSPALQLLIRRTRYRRQIAVDLSNRIGEKAKEFSKRATLLDKPEKLSGEIRTLLNITLDEQFSWKDDYKAINNWINAIENLGILVFQSSDVPIIEMRGFSISEEQFPVIVLNAKDSPRGRIFTLMHELTHLFLRNGGLCDLDESEEVRSEEQRVEAYCNHVAGAVLVPRNALLQEKLVVEKKKIPNLLMLILIILQNAIKLVAKLFLDACFL